MPITIRPSPNKVGRNSNNFFACSKVLLTRSALAHFMEKVSYSSFHRTYTCPNTIPYTNGFVKGFTRAYQQDLDLILRLDNVWLAVIV
jgi:hypothetical protein